MTGARSYTTKIWRQPSSIGFSSADVLSTSMDPPGEPVISTRKRPCQKIQNGSEFPELVAQNSRNPHLTNRISSTTLSLREPINLSSSIILGDMREGFGIEKHRRRAVQVSVEPTGVHQLIVRPLLC